MKKIKLLLAFCALLIGWSNASAQSWTGNAPADQKKFYLYNVGAQKFINNGDPKEGWGTNAYLQAGFGMDITFELSNGAYNLNTNVSNGGNSHYLGTSTWCDGDATPWTFTAVAGQANTYTISNGDFYLVANDALNDVEYKASTDNSKSWWKLVSLEDFKAAMNAKVYSSSDPMDVSVFIQGRSFARNDGRNSSWTTTHSGGNWDWIAGAENRYYGNEAYNNTFDVYQVLSNLPAGMYEVQCSGFDTKGTTNIYATTGDVTTQKALQTDNTTSRGTNKQAMWRAIMEDNAFAGQSTGRFFFAGGDATIKIGVKRESTKGSDWCVYDEFRLYYYGNAEEVSSKITNPNFDSNASGWSGTEPAWGSSEIEFYNKTFDMYQDLTDLSAGIYALEVQGFYRNGAGIDEKRAKAQESLLASIYAKGEDGVERSTSLLSIYEEAGKVAATASLFGYIPDRMNEAQNFISAGYYKDNKVIVEVGAGGTLRIGAKKTGGIGADWTILDNFSLTKLNYATLAEAYAAEWTARKTSAQALLNNSDYSDIVSGSTQRTALSSAVSATPSDLAGYISALANLRNAVNNFKAAKYAYNLYATNAAAATEAYNAEGTTYVNVTGDEKTTFNTAYATNVSGFSPATNNAENYYNAAVAIGSATDAFTNETVKNNYNEYAAEVATATLLGTDVSGVATPTTSSAALTAAHSINVLNYNKVVAEKYEDVSGTTLGAWTDNNVAPRRGQHWDGTTDVNSGTEYFEMNAGWFNTSWNMSRSQTVNLAAGKYILKVACRVSTYANATLSVTVGGNTISTISGHQGDNGKGITTSGVASYDEDTFANTTGRGFEWKYIPFELAETGNATLSFSAEGHAQYQYVSFTSLALLTDPKVAARTSLLNKINEANTKYNGGANVGAGIFQVPAAAGTTFSGAISTAQGVYDNEDADLSEITGATTTLNTAIETYEATELNAPDAEKRYNIILTYAEYEHDGKAITYIANDRADMGLYNVKYLVAPNANYAQAFTFTKVSGNTYKMSQTDVDGNTRYLCTGVPYSGEAVSIRTTTDVDDALTVKIIATGTANVFNIYNTEANNYIGSQDAGVYTVNSHINFTLAEASQATVPVKAQAGKYGTIIFPFTPDVSEGFDGITFYSCNPIKGESVEIEPIVGAPQANTPYIIKKTNGSDFSKDLSGWGTAAKDSYPDAAGLLTGIYTDAEITVGNYVLQTLGGVQSFYQVRDAALTGVAYRAYLTVPTTSVKMFNIVDGTATGVEAPEVTEAEEEEILYNTAGVRVGKDYKGIVINQKGEKRLQK